MTARTLLAAALTAAATTATLALADPEFSADRIKAHVTFLADDLLEGREAGTRGHEVGARYIAAQLALSGVTPGATDGSYFQNVDLLESAHTGRKATLTMTMPSGTRKL